MNNISKLGTKVRVLRRLIQTNELRLASLNDSTMVSDVKRKLELHLKIQQDYHALMDTVQALGAIDVLLVAKLVRLEPIKFRRK
jgi:hypothetical protein